MENDFELGPVKIENGKIVKVGVKKATTWNFVPLAFCKGEKLPFSGTAEEKYPSGQILEEKGNSFRECCKNMESQEI